jgi:hypothetical protein
MRPLLKGRNADEETGPSVGRGSVIRTRDPLLPKKGEFLEKSGGIPTVASPFTPRRVNGLAHESERARDLSAYREAAPWAA